MNTTTFASGLVPLLIVLSTPLAAQQADAGSADHPLLWLGLLTLLMAVAFAVWQLFRVRKAKRRHEHTSLNDLGR